jgi:hypothetical protein
MGKKIPCEDFVARHYLATRTEHGHCAFPLQQGKKIASIDRHHNYAHQLSVF